MNYKVYILVLLCFASTTLTGQDLKFEWLSQFNGQVDVGATVTDQSGAVYHLVSFINSVDFDPGEGVSQLTSKGSYDIAILKYSALGKLIWTYQIGALSTDYARDIAIDQDANLYLTGSFRGNVNFGGSSTSFFMTSTPGSSSASSDVFVCKIDSSGLFLWANKMGGSDGDSGNSIELDRQQNKVIVTGSYTSEDFKPNPFLQPAIQWTIPFNGTSGFVSVFSSSTGTYRRGYFFYPRGNTNDDRPIRSVPSHVTIDSLSNIYLTGSFNAGCDFAPGAEFIELTNYREPGLPPNTSNDIFLAKYDSLLNLKWVGQIGGWGPDDPLEITMDENANIYMVGRAGNYDFEVDFDPSENFYQVTDNEMRTFVAKYDSSGAFQWVNPYSGQGSVLDINQIEFGLDGNLMVGGVFSGSTDFDLSEEQAILEPEDDYSIVIMSLDRSGSFLNASKLIGSDLGTSLTPKLHHDGTNKLYVSGNFLGTYDFDPSSEVQSFTSESTSSPVSFLLKLKECGNTTSMIITSSCDLYTANGEDFTETGIYEQVIPNAIGCDSLITLDITIYPSYEENVTQLLCLDTPFEFGSQTLTMPGSYTEPFVSVHGCDSLVNLTLEEKEFDFSVMVDGSDLTAGAVGDNYQWVNCDDLSEIPGANQRTFTPSESGSYAAMVVDGNCDFMSDCAEIVVLGSTESQKKLITTYPNPVQSTLQLVLPTIIKEGTISMKNLFGKVVLQKSIFSGDYFEFDTSQLPSGIYFLEVKGNNYTENIKVLKK